MFSKYGQRCLIEIQIVRDKNARQCHTELLEACDRGTLPYRTVASWMYAFHSKYEQRCFIEIQIARDKNARQCHTALLEACGRETLSCRTVVRWEFSFHRGREDVHQCHTAIIAVERSVGRLVQQDSLDSSTL